jgi:hypothetical protein
MRGVLPRSIKDLTRAQVVECLEALLGFGYVHVLGAVIAVCFRKVVGYGYLTNVSYRTSSTQNHSGTTCTAFLLQQELVMPCGKQALIGPTYGTLRRTPSAHNFQSQDK